VIRDIAAALNLVHLDVLGGEKLRGVCKFSALKPVQA